MARTFTAVYNPYSFDELVKPLAMYTSEYRRLEDLMNKAYEEGVIEGTIAEGTRAYQIWEGINNSLREVADELATNGMNPLLNKRINSVARNYRMQSKALTQANTAYLQERLRRLNAMDTHVFLNNSSLSIDDFLNGLFPESESVNLLNLTKEVGTEAAQLAAALYSSPDWNNIKTRLGGQVYAVITPNGAPIDLIEASMYSDDAYNTVMENATSEEFRNNLERFRNIYSNAMLRIDYTKYDSLDLLRLDEAIRLGMRAGMEQPRTETIANRNYRTTEQIIQENLNRAAFNFQWAYTGDYGSNNMRITGESQSYRDLQTVRAAQAQGYEPEFNSDGSYKKDENGNIIFRQAFMRPGSGPSPSSNRQEYYNHLSVTITWNNNNEITNVTAGNENSISGERGLSYELLDGLINEGLAPRTIIDELESQGITAENADLYTFVLEGRSIKAKLKPVLRKIETEPLDYNIYVPDSAFYRAPLRPRDNGELNGDEEPFTEVQ